MKEYRIVVLGNVEGIDNEILSVGEENDKVMITDDLVLYNFKSAFEIHELVETFKMNKRLFIINEMGSKKYYNNLNDIKPKPNVNFWRIDPNKTTYSQSGLTFTDTNSNETNEIFTITDLIMKSFTDIIEDIKPGREYTSYELNRMSDTKREKLLDEILGKLNSVGKLTDKDKEMLQILSKTTQRK